VVFFSSSSSNSIVSPPDHGGQGSSAVDLAGKISMTNPTISSVSIASSSAMAASATNSTTFASHMQTFIPGNEQDYFGQRFDYYSQATNATLLSDQNQSSFQQQYHHHQQQQQHPSSFQQFDSDQYSLAYMNLGEVTLTDPFHHNSSSSNTPSPSPSPTHQGLGSEMPFSASNSNNNTSIHDSSVLGASNFMVSSLPIDSLPILTSSETSPIFMNRPTLGSDLGEPRGYSFEHPEEEPGLVIFKKDNVDFRLPSHADRISEFDENVKIMGNGTADMGFTANLPYQAFVYDPHTN